MKDDNGIYILVSPTIEDKTKEEYRVTHLDSDDNITWTVAENPQDDALDPIEVKSYFNKSRVFTSEYDAKEEARRISDAQETDKPIFYIYINTPFPKWGEISYGKKNRN